MKSKLSNHHKPVQSQPTKEPYQKDFDSVLTYQKTKIGQKKGELQMQNPLGLFILGIHGIWRVAWNDANFFMEQTDAKYFPQRLEWLSGMLCFAEAIKNFLNWE